MDGTSVDEVLGAINALKVSVEHKFIVVEQCVIEFRAELAALKLEMVSKTMFDQLESRVSSLEKNGLALPDLTFLRQQVSRLDPANRSVRIRGLKQSIDERKKHIEAILQEIGSSVVRMDHIYKGPKGNRTLTDICIVETSSYEDRENAIKKFDSRPNPNSKVVGDLKIDRAKTQMQLKRNSSLRDALAKLKADPRNKKENIEIIWKKSDPKDKSREIMVGKGIDFIKM